MIIEAIAGTTDFNLDSAVVSAVMFIKLLVNAIYAVEILSECGEIGHSCQVKRTCGDSRSATK